MADKSARLLPWRVNVSACKRIIPRSSRSRWSIRVGTGTCTGGVSNILRTCIACSLNSTRDTNWVVFVGSYASSYFSESYIIATA